MMPNILGIGDVHECWQFCSRNFRIVKCHFTGFLPASRCPFMLRLFVVDFPMMFEVETFSTVKRTSTC